jgi:tetratricopeptide (TPR) repeat protein
MVPLRERRLLHRRRLVRGGLHQHPGELLLNGAVVLSRAPRCSYDLFAMSTKSILLLLFLLPAPPILSLCQAPPSNQDQIGLYSRLAQQYLLERRPELAIPELQKVVALNPSNVDARANLGVLLLFRGDYKGAIPQLRAALTLQPGLSKTQGLLGLAEEHTFDLVDARKDLEASFPAIQDGKFKIEVGLNLVGLYTGTSDLDQAAGVIAQLIKASPDDPEVLYAAYRVYGDLSGASKLRLSVVAPDSAQMHQLLAHEEIREGNTNAAVAQYRKAIAINSQLPGVHFELAELLHTSLDPVVKKEAENEYHAALAANPGDEVALSRLADIAAQRGDAEEAYQEYTQAVAMQPADSDAMLGLAKVLIEMNRPDKAQTLLEQTVQLDPTNATAHFRLATLYRQKGRMDDAKRQLELYKGLREEKDKLRAVYKNLLIQPTEIKADTPNEK